MKQDMRRVRWDVEDITAAASLKSISPKCYRHLKNNMGIPLPAPSTLRRWASTQNKLEVDNKLELEVVIKSN